MDLNRHGLIGGRIILPGTEDFVTLKPKQYFRNDGVVASIEEHVEMLIDEFGWRKKDYDLTANSRNGHIDGLCMYSTAGPYEIAILFVEKYTTPAEDFTFGHESFHLLEWFRLYPMEYLSKKLRKIGFTPSFLKKYNDSEELADACGLISVHQKGHLHIIQDHVEINGNIYRDFLDSKLKGRR
jgi:hypothetical protein